MPEIPALPFKSAGILRVLRASSDPDFDSNYNPINWRVEGRYLLTNESRFFVKALVQVTDVRDFPPDFVQALALKFAAHMSPQVTGSEELTAILENKYKGQLMRAQTADAKIGVQDQTSIRVDKTRRSGFGTSPFSGW